jgi:hypothetical protein
MRRLRFLPTLAFLLLATIVHAQQIDAVTVVPSQPTADDEVFLTIEGQRLSSDMFIHTVTVQQSGNTFTVNIDFMAGGIGLPVLSPFDTTISLGTMAAGNYSATVTGQSMGSPFNSQSANWTVSAVTGIRSVSSPRIEVVAAPNPFMRELQLAVSLPESAHMTVRLYDILGKQLALLANGRFAAGKHTLRHPASSMPDGRYYVQTVINGQTITRQVVKRSN